MTVWLLTIQKNVGISLHRCRAGFRVRRYRLRFFAVSERVHKSSCHSFPQVETVRKLLAEDPAMLLRESLGISADGSEKAFNSNHIEAMMKRKGPPITYNVRNPAENTNHFFVAVDPSGGGASAFSVATVVCGANGFLQVRRHPHRLPRPQLTQRRHHQHQRVWALSHPRNKLGDGHG